MKTLGLVCVVALAGCKGDKPAPAGAVVGSGSGSGSAVSGSAAVPAGSAADAAVAAPTCDLTGDYRLRFTSNGSSGWWWRFKVSGTSAAPKAELLAGIPVLGIESPGPLGVTSDPAACKIVVTAKGGRIGDMTASLTLDAATGKVTGELTRAKPRDDREKKPAAMSGVRDAAGAVPAASACVPAGTYKVTFDPKAKYKTDSKDQDCDIVMLGDINMRFEYLGETLYADALGEKGIEDADSIKVISAKGCDVEIEYGVAEAKAKAKLTFAGGKVTGTATEAEYEIIEDGEAGENMWSCKGKNVAITGTKK